VGRRSSVSAGRRSVRGLDAAVARDPSIPSPAAGIPEDCRIPCVVRWVKPGEGVGLQFEQLRAIEVWALGRLLRGLER
jgi:hypothetical protein